MVYAPPGFTDVGETEPLTKLSVVQPDEVGVGVGVGVAQDCVVAGLPLVVPQLLESVQV